MTTPECSLSRQNQRRIENVVFHPVADFLLSTSSGNTISLWDIHKQQELTSNTESLAYFRGIVNKLSPLYLQPCAMMRMLFRAFRGRLTEQMPSQHLGTAK